MPTNHKSNWSWGLENHPGIISWIIILLLLLVAQSLVHDLTDGLRLDWQWLDALAFRWSSMLFGGCLSVHCCSCVIIERALAEEIVPNLLGLILHFLNMAMLLLMPLVFCNYSDGFSYVAVEVFSFCSVAVVAKLLSFIQVNAWHRRALKTMPQYAKTEPISYPDNVTLSNFFFFCGAPTFCYEINFPRTKSINKFRVLQCSFQLVALVFLKIYLFQQHIVPPIREAVIPLHNMDPLVGLHVFLKIALPIHMAWWSYNFIIFKSFFPLMGELLRFQSEPNHKMWWNSNNTIEFWRTWNLPIHRWALRHVYFPLVDMGHRKILAGVVVFFMSAFYHEIGVSLAMRTYNLWTFAAMMLQMPFAGVCDLLNKCFGSRAGNMIVWGWVIFGNTVGYMLYYTDYIFIHHPQFVAEQRGRIK